MNWFSGMLATAALVLCASVAEARPQEVERALPDAERVGEARYDFLTWTLFDAALWAENGAFSWERPFALTLTYRQSFSAHALADRTLAEMSRRGAGDVRFSPQLRERLHACFHNVTPGDRITGFSSDPNSATFYYNGQQRCALQWPGFRRAFFGIWLEGRGADRAMSARLRGVRE